MSTEDIYSKMENKISVREIDESSSKSWAVKENGKENVYHSYSMLPEKVKQLLSRRDELKRKAVENGSFQMRAASSKIEITENGKTQVYDSFDDVPEKYRERMPDGIKLIDAMKKGKTGDMKRIVRDMKNNLSSEKYSYGQHLKPGQNTVSSGISYKTIVLLVVFIFFAYALFRILFAK